YEFNGPKDIFLGNVAKGFWAKLVNQLVGIKDPEQVTDSRTKQIMLELKVILKDLLGLRGAELVPELGGYETNLLFNAEQYKKGAEAKGTWKPDTKITSKEFGGIDLDVRETAPQKGWWKVNMEGWWSLHEGGEDTLLKRWTEGSFKKAYHDPFLLSAENYIKLNRGGAVSEQEREKLYEMKHLFGRMYDWLNTENPNSFRYTNETMKFYNEVTAEFVKQFALKQFKGTDAKEEDIKKFKEYLGSLDNSKLLESFYNNTFEYDVLKKFNAKSGVDVDYNEVNIDLGRFKSMIGEKATYDLKSEGVWVQSNEGGLFAVSETTPLSDFDRVINGVVAYKDKDGKWKEFDPRFVDITKELKGTALLGMVEEARGSRDPLAWRKVMFESQKALEKGEINPRAHLALGFEYSRTTRDWMNFWGNKDVRVKLMNNDEFLQQGSTTFKSGLWQRLKKLGFKFGYAAEKWTLDVFGMTIRSLDEINMISEYYRQNVVNMTNNIMGYGSYSKNPLIRDRYRGEFEGLVREFEGYHRSWDFTVDRHPLSKSTGEDMQFMFKALYHHGPASTKGYLPALDSYFEPLQRAAVRPYHGIAKMALNLMAVPVSTFRAYKLASDGMPSRYDQTFDQMDGWARTPTRFEKWKYLFNPWSTWRDEGLIFHSEAVDRGVSGSALRSGGGAAPEDIVATVKNIFIDTREGNVNPSLSYYDYYGRMNLGVKPADHLLYRSTFRSFYEDAEMVKEQAISNTVKRTVAAVPHHIHRTEHLKIHGSPMINKMWRYFSPIGLAWHTPFMGYHNGIGPRFWKKMVQSKYGYDSEPLFTTHGLDMAGKIANAAKALKTNFLCAQPFTKKNKYIGTTYCPHCGSLKPRGQPCNKCRRSPYDASTRALSFGRTEYNLYTDQYDHVA
ncbi:hypothetical protein JXB01_03780, partial [Candidatus Micrarchaeota archaeon]|nr:hypothetical protein [Candidatus Micrarchaeota archaeon]